MGADHDAITRLEQWRVDHEQVHHRDREQLDKDFTEQQRRLDLLNHAHEEARRKEGDFASKDEVGVTQADLVRRIDKNSTDIASLFLTVQGMAQNTQGTTAGGQRVQTLAFALLGAAITIAAIVVAVIH